MTGCRYPDSETVGDLTDPASAGAWRYDAAGRLTKAAYANEVVTTNL